MCELAHICDVFVFSLGAVKVNRVKGPTILCLCVCVDSFFYALTVRHIHSLPHTHPASAPGEYIRPPTCTHFPRRARARTRFNGPNAPSGGVRPLRWTNSRKRERSASAVPPATGAVTVSVRRRQRRRRHQHVGKQHYFYSTQCDSATPRHAWHKQMTLFTQRLRERKMDAHVFGVCEECLLVRA